MCASAGATTSSVSLQRMVSDKHVKASVGLNPTCFLWSLINIFFILTKKNSQQQQQQIVFSEKELINRRWATCPAPDDSPAKVATSWLPEWSILQLNSQIFPSVVDS